MTSTRLPGKVLADIAGKTMLQRIVERVDAARGVDEVVVATTREPEDDPLVEYASRQLNCPVYRGSLNDVLGRFFECAKLHRAGIVVRVTADDPLKDPQLIDKAIGMLKADPKLDYCSNTIEPTYPEGLDIEAMRFSALARAHEEAHLPYEREHVTPYIYRNPELFSALNFKADRDLSNWRWTVDKPQDLEFARRVFAEFREFPLVPFQDVIAWLDTQPHIRAINAGTVRNEGYLQSLDSRQ